MNENVRKRIFDTLQIDEGIKYSIYKDHLGYPTFGVGHLITKDDPEYGLPIGSEVSGERVWSAFESDLEISIEECRILYPMWDEFPSEVHEILVNMMFNMGRPRLSSFKRMNAHLANGEWHLAAEEGRDSRWYNQVTNRAERLMTRLERVEDSDGEVQSTRSTKQKKE